MKTDEKFEFPAPRPWHIEGETIRDRENGVVMSAINPANMETRSLIVRAVNERDTIINAHVILSGEVRELAAEAEKLKDLVKCLAHNLEHYHLTGDRERALLREAKERNRRMSGMRTWVLDIYAPGSVCRKWQPEVVPFVNWLAKSKFPPRSQTEHTLRTFMRHANVSDVVMAGFECALTSFYHAIGRKTDAEIRREAYEAELLMAEMEHKEQLRNQHESAGRRFRMQSEGTDYFDRQYEGVPLAEEM